MLTCIRHLWNDLDWLFRLVLMSFILILSYLISIQRREPCLGDFILNIFFLNTGWHSDIYGLISFKLSVCWTTLQSTLWQQCEWLWSLFKVTVIWDSSNFCTFFWPMLYLFCTVDILWRELHMMIETTQLYSLLPVWNDLDLHSRSQDYEIAFVHCVCSKLAWSSPNTWTFTQGLRIMR